MFNKSLDEFIETSNSQKANIVRFLRNNFKENIHYEKNILPKNKGKFTTIKYNLTDETYDLMENTFNRRNRNIIESSKIKQINLLMCLETQTIGFITQCFDGIYPYFRQYSIEKYRVDLCFEIFKLVIECDENDHINRNTKYEKERQAVILLKGYSIIRFNPNNSNFKLHQLINTINKYIAGLITEKLIII